VMVPASEDVIIISGVLSFGGVVIVLPEITGGVVSVLPPPVLVSVPVDCKVIPKLRLFVCASIEKLCDYRSSQLLRILLSQTRCKSSL